MAGSRSRTIGSDYLSESFGVKVLLCTTFEIGSNLPLRWASKKLAAALLDEA